MSSQAPLQNTSDEGSLDALPIHEQNIAVNPQNDCPLFNGRIPPEIRDEIFSYALTEMTSLNPSSAYSKNISRPGYTARRTITIALLQTCRRIYLETYHLPVLNKEHIFWHGPDRGPYRQQFPNIYDLAHEEWYFGQMTPWQLKLVKEIHLFTQMFWLEGSSKNMAGKNYMANVERLKITITRRDWWWNESNRPLFIHPKRTVSLAPLQSAAEMLAAVKRDKTAKQEGRKLEPFEDNAWGGVFRKFPSLKELEFEFETSEDKTGELETVIEWAKLWRFPMNDGMVLSAEDSIVKTSTWVGPRSFWTRRCPYCGSGPPRCVGEHTDDFKDGCRLKKQRMMKDEGPTLLVMSLGWKLVKDLDVGEE